MQPYPRSPDLVPPGQLHGRGCLIARAVDTGSSVGVFGHGLWCCPSFAGWGLRCLRLGLGFGLLMGRVWLRAHAVCPPAVSGSGVRCGRACWGLSLGCAPPLLGGVLGCVCAREPVPRGLLHLLVGVAVRGCVFVRTPRLFFAFPGCVWACVLGPGLGCAPPFLVGLSGCVLCALFFGRVLVGLCGVGCWLSLSQALWSLPPHPLSVGLGCWLFFFFQCCVCLHVLVSLFLVGCCSWLGVAGLGWEVPLCLFGGPVFGAFWVRGMAASCGVSGRFGGCGLFSPPPSPPCFFLSFGGGGAACSSLCLPWAGARTGLHSVWSSGLLLAVAVCLAVFRPHGSDGLCTRSAWRPFLPG